jgi:hypothetical protein
VIRNVGLHAVDNTLKINWTPELTRAALKVETTVAVGRLWLVLVGGLVIAPIGLIYYLKTGQPNAFAAAFAGFFFLAVYLWARFTDQRRLRDHAKIAMDPHVTVSLHDDSIKFSGDDFTEIVRWSQVSRLRDVGGFLVLFSGNIIRAMLPVGQISHEQRQFIESSINGTVVQPGDAPNDGPGTRVDDSDGLGGGRHR